MQTTQAHERVNDKERYHAVLQTVSHQSSPEQLPGVRPATLTLILAGHGRYSPDGVGRPLRAAVENEDLFTWLGADGRRRVTLATIGDLQQLSVYVTEQMRAEPLLERVNRAIVEVRV